MASLVRRLAPSGSAAEQAEAAHALARLCSDKSPNREYVRGCGGVAALVGLLAPCGSAAVHGEAAAALRNLCIGSAQNQDTVRECGGVAALVGLLAPGGSPAVQERAAAALRNMCFDNKQGQDGVREGGGVAALVGLLVPGGSAAVQWEAAGALTDLCLGNAKNRDSLRECGGVAALVALLAPGCSASTQKQAAGALGNLCVGNTQNQDSVRECGGVAALVGLLATGRSAGVQKRAAAALGNLCSDGIQNKDSVRECGGVAAPVGLLAPGNSAGVHEQAARALRNLCTDNLQIQDSMRECGGVAVLVRLLVPGGTGDVHEHAAAALWSLGIENTRNQDSVRECEVVSALVRLLASACPATVHQIAAGALFALSSAFGQSQDGVQGSPGACACMRQLSGDLAAARAGGGCAAQPGACLAGCWATHASQAESDALAETGCSPTTPGCAPKGARAQSLFLPILSSNRLTYCITTRRTATHCPALHACSRSARLLHARPSRSRALHNAPLVLQRVGDAAQAAGRGERELRHGHPLVHVRDLQRAVRHGADHKHGRRALRQRLHVLAEADQAGRGAAEAHAPAAGRQQLGDGPLDNLRPAGARRQRPGARASVRRLTKVPGSSVRAPPSARPCPAASRQGAGTCLCSSPKRYAMPGGMHHALGYAHPRMQSAGHACGRMYGGGDRPCCSRAGTCCATHEPALKEGPQQPGTATRDRTCSGAASGHAVVQRALAHPVEPATRSRGAHLQQLVGAVGRADAQLLQQLHHQAAEALERARQPHLWIHLHLRTPGSTAALPKRPTGCDPAAHAAAGNAQP